MESAMVAARRAQASRMPGLVSIERVLRVPDGSGGRTTTVDLKAEGLRFRLMPGFVSTESLDQTIVERLGSRTPYYAALEAGSSVAREDRLRQTFPVDQRFEILAIVNADVSYATTVRLIVAEWL